MIYINQCPIEINCFPDGTFLLKENVDDWAANLNTRSVCFEWYFENNAELVALQFLAWHFQEYGMTTRLYMPYIPNARMDRVKNCEDVFTLKYFARIINSIGFERVTVLDPHSSVSEALIDNLKIQEIKSILQRTIKTIKEQSADLQIVFPDEGSQKRYRDYLKDMNICWCSKHRDWETGQIKGLEIHGELLPCDVLIVDDICAYGGSAYYTAQAIKEKQPDVKVYLYVTHCENSVVHGRLGEDKKPLLDTGLIDGLYTTGDILTERHDKIHLV